MDWNSVIIQLAETIHELKANAEYFRIKYENEHHERMALEQRYAELIATKEEPIHD